jgi:acetamidase/formamidase
MAAAHTWDSARIHQWDIVVRLVLASRAVRAMIAWLGNEHGVDHRDVYMLWSLAGDLKVIEIAGLGRWRVAWTMPGGVFDKS